MKYIKVIENGQTNWKRQPKEYPTKSRIKEIEVMRPKEARSLPTEDKMIWLYTKINLYKKAAKRNEKLPSNSSIIIVERSNLLRDSFEQFKTGIQLDLRKELKIHFVDEISQDAGGLVREWFSVLTEELFAFDFGLFVRTNTLLQWVLSQLRFVAH